MTRTTRSSSKKVVVAKTRAITRSNLALVLKQAQEYENYWRARSLKATLRTRREHLAKQALKRKHEREAVIRARTSPKKVLASPISTVHSLPSLPALPAVSAPAPAASIPSLHVPVFIPPVAPAAQPKKPAKPTTKTASDSLAIPSVGVIDVCFVMDATGSMGSYLSQGKDTIQSLISKVSSKVQMEGISIKFAVVAYKDHCDKEVVNSQDFTDADTVHRFLGTLSANGGGDEPEATHDGIMAACGLSWRNFPGLPTLRYIFHITDAPPHGKEFVPHESQEGCTCGIKTDYMLNIINKKDIHYRLIKTTSGNTRLDKMDSWFNERIANYESTTIQHAKEMDVRVSDMVIRELMPETD